MLGRYMDALPEAARARVSGAQLWTVRGYVDPSGARSLLGHAENWYWDDASQEVRCRSPELLPIREAGGDSWLNWPPLLEVRYDHLVFRLGLAEAVKMISTRAARAAPA